LGIARVTLNFFHWQFFFVSLYFDKYKVRIFRIIP